MNFVEVAPLVERMKGGDIEAFDELYACVWKDVYYIALRHTNNPTDAMDVTQNVLIVVNKEIHKLKSIYAFSSWVHRITYNECVDFIKKNNKFETILLSDVEDQLAENRKEFLPNEVLTSKETQEQVLELINSLPTEQKQALLLYYYAEMSTKEIAISMGISVNAAQLKISRARVKIKKKVEEMCKSGSVVFSVVPIVPVLTQILRDNSANVCTAQVKEIVMKSVVAKLSAPVAKSVFSTTIAKIMLGVASLAVVSGGVAIVTQLNSPSEQQEISESNNPASGQMPTAIEKVETLEDFIGIEDASFILSGKQVQPGYYHELFLQIAEKHQISFDNLYFDEDDPDYRSYLVYHIDKQDKRLILVESYNSLQDSWQISYKISDIADTLPTKVGAIELFQEYLTQ